MLLNSIILFFLIWIPTIVLSENIVPTPNYRTPKKIVFSTQGGGSSHHMWVLEILKEMHNRGHNVSFFSRGDQLRFAKEYPMVKTREVGGPEDFVRDPLLIKHLSSHPPQELISVTAIEVCMVNYPAEFFEHQGLFESEKIDLVICDSFAMSCIDTAIVSKLPVVITSTVGIYADFSANYINNILFTAVEPTTQNESLWFRIYRDYIHVPTVYWSLSRRLKHTHAFQRKIGLEPTADPSAARYNDIPKFINNVFGIELSRKHSPLLHMVGPIMRGSYPPIDNASENFLNVHTRVAYVAFGQHAAASSQDVQMIIQTLLRLREEGHIDGIVWTRLNKDQLPEFIQTPKQTYSRQDIANHPDIFLINWAPQYAILQHPATSFFITHGGVGSMHEALYLGRRLFVYPFFGDQPANARAVEYTGIGRFIDTMNMKYDKACYDLFYKKLYDVAVDPQKKIQNTVNKYSAYVQVMATNAITRGADLLEESLFASDEHGKLNYRYDVGHGIHWIKRYNVDIYAVFAILGFLLYQLGTTLVAFAQTKYKTIQKLKTV